MSLDSRFVRATEEQLSTALEHLQAIARITTGIALQTALIDGKYTADELISELLLLGSVTPSQMKAIDRNELLNTLTALKDLPDQLVDSGDVKKVEEKLEKMEEVRKLVEKAGGGSKWVGKKEFMEEMEKVKRDGVNLKQVSSAHKAIKDWNSAMEKVNDSSTKTQDYRTYIGSLKENSGKILEKAKELDKPTAYSAKYFTIESAKKSLDPLSTLVGMVDKAKSGIIPLTSSAGTEATHFATIQNNIKVLADLSSSLGSVVPDIQTIQNVLEARESPVGQSLKYPGFTNGFHDLETISINFANDWVRKVVDVEQMTSALKPINALIPAFKRVDEAFKFSDSESLKKVSKLTETVNEVTTVSPDAANTTTALDGLWKCRTHFSKLNDPVDTNVRQFIKMAEEMDTNFEKVRTSVDTFVQKWNNAETIKQLNDVSGLFVIGNDDAVLKKTIETLRNSTEMQKLYGVMLGAETAYGSVQGDSNSIKQNADNIIKKSAEVDTYIGSLSNYQPLFKCLDDFGQDRAGLVNSGIGISKKFRTAKGNGKVVEDGEKVIDGVLKAADTFGGLKDSLGKMKGVSSPESDALQTLSEPEKHSEVFGRATRGIRSMKQSFGEKQKADIVIQSAGIVETQLANVSLDQEDVDSLKAVIQLNGSLPMTYQKLAEWKNQNVDESSTVLVSYSPLFSSAQNVPGVGGNLWEMSSSVEKLASKVTDPDVQRQLRELQTALFTFASIGTDFASFTPSFIAAKDSLTALDTFFVNYRKNSTSETSGWPISWKWIIGGVVVAGCSVFICAGGGYCYVVRHRKRKEASKHAQESHPFIANQVSEVVPKRNTNGNAKTIPRFTEITYQNFIDELIRLLRYTRKGGKYGKKAIDRRQAYFNRIYKYVDGARKSACLTNPSKNTDFKYNVCRPHKFNIRLGESYKALESGCDYFPNDFFHANHIVLPNGAEFILAQSPWIGVHNKHEVDTIERFWYKVITENVKYIVEVFEEVLIEEESGEQVARYYVPAYQGKFTHKRVVVDTREIPEDLNGIDVRFVLEVSFNGGPKHSVTILRSSGWRPHMCPTDHDEIMLILERVRCSDGPVLIHSPHGCGRAGTVALIELGFQKATMNGKISLTDCINEVRTARAGAIATVVQVFFAFRAICGAVERVQPNDVLVEVGACFLLMRKKWLEQNREPAKLQYSQFVM